MQGFCRQMPVFLPEQQVGKRHALPGRTQARGPQAFCSLSIPLFHGWMGTTHLTEPYAFPKALAADTLSSSLLWCT
jgi:hypothetical protein